MPCVLELLRAQSCPRAATLAVLVFGIAGCSADSTRLTENPLFPEPEATASIPVAQPASIGRVESRPLPPDSAQPAIYRTTSTGSSVSGGGRGLVAYNPSSHAPDPAGANAPPTREPTGSLSPKPAASGHWTGEGGSPITAGPRDTIDSIARRYGVPASSIVQANNLPARARLRPGQQLVIPRYNRSPVDAPASRTASSAHRSSPVAATAEAGGSVHVVAPGESLIKIARHYGRPVKDIAKANNIQANAILRGGDRLVIPGAHRSAAKLKGAPANPPPPGVQTKVASVAPVAPESAPTAALFTPAAEPAAGSDAGKPSETTGALPKFRWPANGRVIASYGPTSSGQQNDGINIALPENTPIKAAEDGVVAYAGNELKGYGNLVLVRHPNGYVTAYAHAKELLVKRGDQIKRGQVIARSGQTGNVSAPQLHFEVRKGASPLDPMKFLGG